jgi:putative salt-induced outer membrane protein YdiY
MTNRLALAAGYQLTDNSQPPQGSERRDTLTTLNLVYELKNEKLAPE